MGDTLNQSLGKGKWSIKQAISDDHTPFQSYDPEMYVKERAYEWYTAEEIKRLKERRNNTLQLLAKDIWEQSGLHPEEGIMTVQILAETIALHEHHHLDQIKSIISMEQC
ncbi:hypothetical protein Saga11_25600 [Bacillus safensis]|nr:hypothetical protein Saga11_25600 [Bacillus safensis]